MNYRRYVDNVNIAISAISIIDISGLKYRRCCDIDVIDVSAIIHTDINLNIGLKYRRYCDIDVIDVSAIINADNS